MPRLTFLSIFFFLMLGSRDAQAHPHEWIDVKSSPVFNAQGKITALRQNWLFDIYYTALSLPDFDANKNKVLDHQELMKLADENLQNLKDFGYFTTFEENGKNIKFEKVQNVTSQLDQGRIALNFTLIPDHPINPKTSKVNYRIYDPSYYVAMLHEKTDPIHLEGDPKNCSFNLVRPEPNTVWITLAKSLDKNATAPDDLGKYFADRVTITCH